jgi:aspartate kinase
MPTEKRIVVQKYGGSSVADPQRLKEVAILIQAKRDSGKRLCVVVSAMGQTTNELLSKAKEVSSAPSRRELDMLLSCGERASMALLAMALDALGVPSISFTGSQSGIMTNDQHSSARILEVRPYRVQDELEKDKVVIIAGYQGVSYKKEITTLGRGGSDTTAVAMAAALNAEACEIYSDVDGVYSADPKVVPQAVALSSLGYDEMLALSKGGARVLNAQAVAYARDKNISLYAKKTGSVEKGTLVYGDSVELPKRHWAFAHREQTPSYQAPENQSLSLALSMLASLEVEPLYWVKKSASWCFLLVPEDAHGHEQLLDLGWQRQMDKGTLTAVASGLGQDLVAVSSVVACVEEKSMPDQVHVTENSVTFVLQSSQVLEVLRGLHDEFITG